METLSLLLQDRRMKIVLKRRVDSANGCTCGSMYAVLFQLGNLSSLRSRFQSEVTSANGGEIGGSTPNGQANDLDVSITHSTSAAVTPELSVGDIVDYGDEPGGEASASDSDRFSMLRDEEIGDDFEDSSTSDVHVHDDLSVASEEETDIPSTDTQYRGTANETGECSPTETNVNTVLDYARVSLGNLDDTISDLAPSGQEDRRDEQDRESIHWNGKQHRSVSVAEEDTEMDCSVILNSTSDMYQSSVFSGQEDGHAHAKENDESVFASESRNGSVSVTDEDMHMDSLDSSYPDEHTSNGEQESTTGHDSDASHVSVRMRYDEDGTIEIQDGNETDVIHFDVSTRKSNKIHPNVTDGELVCLRSCISFTVLTQLTEERVCGSNQATPRNAELRL